MAKIIIDIPDSEYKKFQELIAINLGRCSAKGIIQTCLSAIRKGTVIPTDATNGDVIKAVFQEPNYKFEQGEDKNNGLMFMFDLRNENKDWYSSTATIDRDWWKLPFKRKDEKNESNK